MRSAWIKGLVIAGAAAALVGCTLAPGARLALVCYDDTGATVSSFNGGFVITDIADSDAETAFAVAIAPWVYDVHVDDERPTEGNLAVAGDAGSRSARRFMVARYRDINGDLEDHYFADGGIVLTDFPGAVSASALAMDIEPGTPYVTSTIAVAGKAVVDEEHRFAVARYHWYGAMETNFGNDGRVLTSFPGADDAVARAVALTPTETGFQVVAGGDARFPDGRRFAVARYRGDGNLDNSFDDDGRVITDFAGSTSESIADLAIVDTDGEKLIVAAGRASGNDGQQIALARYLWDGSLDTTFGSGGRIMAAAPGSDGSYAQAVQVDDRGRIVVAGVARDAEGNSRFMVARFTTEGVPDLNFGGAGFSTIDFPGAIGALAHGMDIDSEGRILVAGQAFADGWKFAVARFLADGTLDSAFDGDGRVLTDLPTHNEIAFDITFDRRGRINYLVCAAGQAGD